MESTWCFDRVKITVRNKTGFGKRTISIREKIQIMQCNKQHVTRNRKLGNEQTTFAVNYDYVHFFQQHFLFFGNIFRFVSINAKWKPIVVFYLFIYLFINNFKVKCFERRLESIWLWLWLYLSFADFPPYSHRLRVRSKNTICHVFSKHRNNVDKLRAVHCLSGTLSSCMCIV